MVCKPGWHHTKETREKMSAARMGRKQPLWVREKIGEAQRLEKHWNWQGGVSFTSYLPYPVLQVKVRDNFTCQHCGRRGDGARFLHVHHEDYDKYNNNLSNLVTLCNVCHGKTNNKEYRENYFRELYKGVSQ